MCTKHPDPFDLSSCTPTHTVTAGQKIIAGKPVSRKHLVIEIAPVSEGDAVSFPLGAFVHWVVWSSPGAGADCNSPPV